MKNRKTLWLLAALLLCSVGNAAAAGPEKLTITQAAGIAVANSPDLRSARAQVAAAQAQIALAKSKHRPQLSFNGIAKDGLAAATNGLALLGLPASPFYTNFAEALNVNQDIFDFGRTSHSVALMRAQEESAEQDLAETTIRVVETAKVAYLKVLSAQQLLQARQEDLRERQQIERKASEFFQAGLSSKLELDLAQVGSRTAELAVAQAQDDEQAAWADLFAALGEPAGPHYQLVDLEFQLVAPGDVATEINQALATRPDLKSVQAQVRAQLERLQYAQSLRRPYLGFVFTGGYARVPALLLSNQTSEGVGLSAPLYTGGGLKAQIQAEQHNLESIRARYASEVLAVRAEVSQDHAAVLKALASAEDDQKIAAYAEGALRLAQTRYQAQLTSFVEMITAEDATEQARANYAQAIYSYQIAKAHLNAAMGSTPQPTTGG